VTMTVTGHPKIQTSSTKVGTYENYLSWHNLGLKIGPDLIIAWKRAPNIHDAYEGPSQNTLNILGAPNVPRAHHILLNMRLSISVHPPQPPPFRASQSCFCYSVFLYVATVTTILCWVLPWRHRCCSGNLAAAPAGDSYGDYHLCWDFPWRHHCCSGNLAADPALH